jgi:ankyrin repeat protein
VNALSQVVIYANDDDDEDVDALSQVVTYANNNEDVDALSQLMVYAIDNNDEDALTQLLINAIDYEDMEATSLLLNAGANINALWRGWFGYDSLLMHAISMEKYTAAKYLIKTGADVRFVNDHGLDALKMIVNQNGPLEIINMLIQKGASIEVVNSPYYWNIPINDAMLLHVHNQYRSYLLRILEEIFGNYLICSGNRQAGRYLTQDMLRDIAEYAATFPSA